MKKENEKFIYSTKSGKSFSFKNKNYFLSPSYPGTNNPELMNYYDICIDEGDNSKEFIAELRKMNIFDEMMEYEICYAACDDPSPPVNDSKIVDGSIDNYALDIIDADCAWAVTKGDPRVIIGIADSDFQTNHEDLENQIIRISGEITAGHIHGTCVSGAAAAETNNNKGIAGIGRESKIAAYRINHYISSDGARASSQDIKNAIWQAYLDGCPIINVSWTGTGLSIAAAQEIVENGTTLVLAAGNTPDSDSHSSIAAIPGVIIVSSSNKQDEYFTGHARNKYIDICAPGFKVAVTAPNSTYWNASGTSYASPIVAGAAALMLSVNPCLNPSEIENIIKTTAAPLANADLYPGLVGSGRLDVYNAVKKTLELGSINIQNKIYTGTTIEEAETAIKAGNSILPNVTSGNVVVTTGSNVTFRATRDIELSGGFEVQHGAAFNAEIYTSVCY